MAAAESQNAVLRRLETRSSEIRALGVVRLGLFGSVARDEAGPESDVDILVELAPDEKSFDGFLQLAELLETILERPVELVTTDALSPHIGPKILREVRYVPLAS